MNKKISKKESVVNMAMKPPSSMSIKEIKILIEWAQAEIQEYQDFIYKLAKELLKRNKI
jgi:hypothetical protein